MTPRRDRDPDFALLCQPAGFSRAVISALQRRQRLPRLLVLPHYAPAARRQDPQLPLATAPRDSALPTCCDTIEIAYAPAARQHECAQLLAARKIEFLLVACWPYLIAPELVAAAAQAALNLHPSLLPRDRGPDPLGGQLRRGERSFGVTLHLLDQRFDAGDIIAQQKLAGIPATAQRAQLETELATLGVDLFIDALQRYPHWTPRPQTAQALDID